MKRVKADTLRKWLKDGRVELNADVTRSGYADITWRNTGKRETIEVSGWAN